MYSCTKCGKELTSKQALDRHLVRKFPCDQVKQVQEVSVIRPLDCTVIPKANTMINLNIEDIVSLVFTVSQRNPSNRCFVRINAAKDEYLVWVSADQVEVVSQAEFIRLWVNHVLTKIPYDDNFAMNVWRDSRIDLKRNDWDGKPRLGSYVYDKLKSTIGIYMIKLLTKAKLKSDILRAAEAMMNTSHTPALE
jgi:hypothetical protein